MGQIDTQRQVGAPGGNIVLDLYVLNQRIGELLESVLAHRGVTPAEYAVYSQLGISALTPSELNRRLGLKASTLSGHLAALRRRGHTRQITDAADRRSYRVELTPAGHQCLQTCRPLFRDALDRLHGNLELDLADVRRMLAAIDSAAQQAVTEPDPLRTGPERPAHNGGVGRTT